MLNNHALLLKGYEKHLLSLLFTDGVLIKACNPNLKIIMHVWHIQVCSQCSFWLPLNWMDFKELILLSLVTRNLIKWVLTLYHKKVMQTTAPIKKQGFIFQSIFPTLPNIWLLVVKFCLERPFSSLLYSPQLHSPCSHYNHVTWHTFSNTSKSCNITWSVVL